MKTESKNIKIMTKEDVINLDNEVKCYEFLKNYENWGVWLDINEMNVQIYKAELPDNQAVYVTKFKNGNKYGDKYSSPVYSYATNLSQYNAKPETCAFIADELKKLRTLFLLDESKKAC